MPGSILGVGATDLVEDAPVSDLPEDAVRSVCPVMHGRVVVAVRVNSATPSLPNNIVLFGAI